ncbi:UNVERIFIED_CONTAM: hypothetical protein Sindi_2878800 [Sesamum indicum]
MPRCGRTGQRRYFYSSRPQSERRRMNMMSLTYVAAQVNRFVGRQWSMPFYKKKLLLVRLRYDTLRKVLADRCITWNKNTNRISGSNDDWKRVFRATPFARTYRYAGERRWWEMKEIFCGDDITASEATTSQDGGECSHRRVQVEGEIEVIDLAISSEDE